ncbi:MAG: PEP-CTERM sorting domain-containing protein [Verrucomicrobia bacterium]|nr:PEP-CTERM sorting domain-containing protein [Verrucomicrobiota bacterium]MCH8513692.1 PEP-CTERM sorting domain-containing protein [Kiritimatiellia bacterium]
MKITFFQTLVAALCIGTASADVLVSWGPAFDILNNRFVSMQNTTTSSPAGTINGSEAGTFLYRSHTTAIITNQVYDNAPASPDYGWATASWTPTTAPSLFSRIEGRDSNAPNGDFLQLSNSSSNSNYAANLLWWDLAESFDATSVPAVSVKAQTSGGTFSLMARQGTQWYIADLTSLNTQIEDINTLNWTAYSPTDGTPVSMFANNSSADNVGALSALTFGSVTLDNITGFGIYHERINTNSDRNMQVLEFTVTAIPEPGTLVLIGITLGSLVVFRRRK